MCLRWAVKKRFENRLRDLHRKILGTTVGAAISNLIRNVGSMSICPVLLIRDLSGLVDLAFASPSACRRGFACFLLIHDPRRRSGGKVEIPPALRDFQGAVGAVGNRFLVFHGFHGPVFSKALLLAL